MDTAIHTQAKPAKLVYTVRELCAMLRLSRPTVRGLIRDGALRAIRVGRNGRKILVPAASVRAFLQSCDTVEGPRIGSVPASRIQDERLK